MSLHISHRLIKPALGITLQCVGFELTEGSGKQAKDNNDNGQHILRASVC